MNGNLFSGNWSTIAKQADEKALHNAKLLLRLYKDVVWRVEEQIVDLDAACFDTDGKRLSDLVDCLIDADTQIDFARFEAKLRSLHASKAMIEVVDKALAMIKSYPDHGGTYYDILYYQYVVKGVTYKEKQLLDKLNLEKTTFYRRKKEAVNLFAVILWGYMLPKMREIVMSEMVCT